MCNKPSVWNSGPGLLPKSTIPFDSDMTWSYAIHMAGSARLPEHLPAWTQKEATWQGEVWTCWDMLSTFATIGEYCASQPVTKLFLLRFMLLSIVKPLNPQFCAIIRGMISERRIVEVQWSSGVPFWMPTAHRYESMFDSCLQSWFRRSSTSAPSLGEIQATDHQKVCSKRRFPKWHPQVEAVNAGSTRSARSIRHPTSKTWLTISNSVHIYYIYILPGSNWPLRIVLSHAFNPSVPEANPSQTKKGHHAGLFRRCPFAIILKVRG